MRIRIALTTAVAVIVVAVPAVLMSLFTSDAAWAQANRHQAVSSHQGAGPHHAVRIDDTLMSYSQAQQVVRRERARIARDIHDDLTAGNGQCPKSIT